MRSTLRWQNVSIFFLFIPLWFSAKKNSFGFAHNSIKERSFVCDFISLQCGHCCFRCCSLKAIFGETKSQPNRRKTEHRRDEINLSIAWLANVHCIRRPRQTYRVPCCISSVSEWATWAKRKSISYSFYFLFGPADLYHLISEFSVFYFDFTFFVSIRMLHVVSFQREWVHRKFYRSRIAFVSWKFNDSDEWIIKNVIYLMNNSLYKWGSRSDSG